MKLELFRKPSANGATLGELFIDGVFQCYTLEDVTRNDKIAGETAIPAGTYRLLITWSPRFQRRLPLVVDVPGFEGVRIHPGNSADDTEGCILVGTQISTNTVLNSRAAFDALFKRLEQAAANHESISMEISNSQLA